MIQNEIRLPWEAYEDETISEGTYCIEDSKGEFVAAFILEEHRDFMVRAANNFEALLAAAKVSLAELKDFVITAENMLGGKRVTLHSIALLEAAIAEAEKAE